jgi:predicted phosphodiesterase
VKRRAGRIVCALLALAASFAPMHAATGAGGQSEAAWLVLSDVHFNPFDHHRRPSRAGKDTNAALLASLFGELRQVAPAPPVVFIAGDFLSHGFPVAKATATMVDLAGRFDRAFPHSQFVIALGNNDSDCGDYEATLDGPFLSAVAKAWAPLVDRHGAAPDFVRTFAHDGSYVATLPRPHLRVIAFNDVYDAVRYRNACGTGNPAATSLGHLKVMLRSGANDERTWLVTHVPPGIDAFSTAQLARGLLVVPFLRPGAREHLLDLVDAPANRVALMIAGHTHRFSFRLSGGRGATTDVPILIAPSVSPVFGNSPGFLTLDVGADGTIWNVTDTARVRGRWERIDTLADVGVRPFDAAQLRGYEARLKFDPALRARFARMYGGGAPSEIDSRNWRIYWCAATELSSAGLRACTSEGGYGIVTRRGFFAAGGVAAIALLLLGIVLFLIRAGLKRAPAKL